MTEPPPGAAAGPPLSHFDERGRARMVDVSEKAVTTRTARAYARVDMAEATLARILDRETAKGDVLQVARLAGILGAKRTPDLIPLCHPLPLESVTLDLRPLPPRSVEIFCEARVTARTGVEMEAMVGAAVAALTVYDMVKGIDRGVAVAEIKLLEKAGGRTGTWRREASDAAGSDASTSTSASTSASASGGGGPRPPDPGSSSAAPAPAAGGPG